MASACRRQLCMNEKRGVRQDLQSWRSELVRRVGIKKISDLLYETRILEDLRLFRDYKPASVSNWSFDGNCLFCCLRREKVKEHVVALNNKFVQSGGKPLLGKDHSNITRLEWQVEEFLNAVLHRKEYTPRIPDPHIPVVACNSMQQMIGQLAVHYTSNTNSQGSSQHNGNMDQSLLKSCSPASTPIAASSPDAASAQNPVLSKLLMADQEAPLDLSVKKVKPEIVEQDGVLDLSIKKNRNPDSSPLQSPHRSVAKSFVTRDSDLGSAQVEDLQSTSTLEQFMAKLCLHHQRQVVDAFGFLQTEVKAVASSNDFQVSSPEKTVTSGSSHSSSEEQSLNQTSKQTPTLSVAISTLAVQDPVTKSIEFHAKQPLKTEASLITLERTGLSVDIQNMDTRDEVLESSNVVDAECRSINIQPKCPSLLIVKNRNSGSLEAKNVTEEDSGIQHVNTGGVEQDLCISETRLQASSSESDILEQTSHMAPGQSEPKYHGAQKSISAHSKGLAARSCTVLRTSNVISTISTRTARKSRKGSHSLQRHNSGCQVINGPNITYDIVYVGKPITECELQSHNRMLPRKNARKSTRGYRYIGECWELKTVRTLAGKSADNGSGNCPVPMPEMSTSVTPKQALIKPDGVPPVDILFAGDFMEPVTNKKPSDQHAETEVPGDVMASEDLIVETSQTDQSQSKEPSSSLLASEQSSTCELQDASPGVHNSVADKDSDTDQENPEDANMANISVHSEAMHPEAKEMLDAPVSDVVSAELETESRNEIATPEPLLSPSSLDKDDKDGTSEPEGLSLGIDLKAQNSSVGDLPIQAVEHPECLEMHVMGTSENAQLQITCGTETNLKPDNDTEEIQSNTAESGSGLSDEQMTEEAQSEECKEEVPVINALDRATPKKAVASSDRCLRSSVSKSTPEHLQSPKKPGPKETQLDIHAKKEKTPESKSPSKTSKLKHVENVSCQDGQHQLNTTENLQKPQRSPVKGTVDNMVCTRQKQKMIVKEMETEKEKNVPESSTPKDGVEGKVHVQGCISNDVHSNLVDIPTKSDESPTKSLRSSERMPLRSSSRPIEQPVGKASSPVKNNVQTSERIPLKNSSVDQPIGDSCSSPAGDHAERPARMPLRSRNSSNAELVAKKDSCISPNKSGAESFTRMPLRSRNCSNSEPVSGDSASMMKDVTNSLIEPNSDLSITSKKLESPAHMPLRSGNVSVVEQPSKSPSSASTSESPGRMSLRRSHASVAEKMDNPATPPKSKKLVKKTMPSSVQEEEQSPKSNVKLKSDQPLGDKTRDSLPDLSIISVARPTISPLIPGPSKFLEALNGEENQHLITDLNSKFDKMQKGWVQMDKEGQPAPKPKNKADRLKEIWKSKKRIRKPRSLEQQKLSPVQMLFMKSFDLPSICRWFLQSTETKSLVIVKKLNTRLPSETQLCFHNSASGPGSSNGVFPSLQAERLKKHLKKYAIASPVKSNAKNKRLIKALAQGISVSKGKEKREPSTATRISTKPHSYTGLMQTQPPEGHSKVTKNPASAKILRKYSNMREKRQVQQNTLKNLEGSLEKTRKTRVMPKNVHKDLSTGKGQRSAIVRNVKALAKKAKTKSAVKERTPKSNISKALKGLKGKASTPVKSVLSKVSKANLPTNTKTTSKKEIQTKAVKSPQTKTDHKKSPSKSLDGLASPSQTADVKLLSEDQVLTRSQRKIEATHAQTGSPKTTVKRGAEPLPTPAKRTRTSK